MYKISCSITAEEVLNTAPFILFHLLSLLINGILTYPRDKAHV